MVRWLVAIVFSCALVALVTPSAYAQEPTAAPQLADVLTGNAKADYVAGRVLFQDGDFAAASVKFKSALEQSKDERLYWNLGACERGLKHYGQAIRHLERFKMVSTVTPTEQKEADDCSLALRAFVAEVSVTADADAEVLIDEQPIGRAPIEKYLVDIGEHRLAVKKEGFTTFTQPLLIKDASPVRISATLEAVLHRGRLSVIAGANDAIAIDDKATAIGRFEGTLSSGVHTVRVTAPKKKPFEQRDRR